MIEMRYFSIRTRYLSIIFICAMMWLYTTINRKSTRSEIDGSTSSKKPHIIMILADDLGFNDVPWHNKDVIAPNLQTLAREGIILEQSYVQPLCSPTRSAIMSGIYPFATGRQDGVIWPFQPTGLTLDVSIIPEYLKPLGYESHAIGKWHLGFCKWEYTPTERGFETFTGYYTGSEDYYTHRRKYTENVDGYDFRDNKTVYRDAKGNYSTYEFASRVETILHSGDPKVPKFLYVAFQSVHAPLQAPEMYTQPYAHIKDKNRRTYLGMVSAMDDAIGRIITALKETGHYDNSVIVFSTDNGGSIKNGASNVPLRGMKTTLWEGGTRGAAFIHSPLLPKPGRVVNNLIHTTDWLATFIKIAGGIPPNGTDSISQWEALLGETPPPRTELVYNIVSTESALTAAIRYKDCKLLVGNQLSYEWEPQSSSKTSSKSTNQKVKKEIIFSINSFEDFFKLGIPLQLYNLTSDPEERTNIASSQNETTIFLLRRLLMYKHRYVPSDFPDDTPELAHPKGYHGVWSPGWC